MEINKVVYNGGTLLDLTSDTVTPQTLLSGATAHAANGQSISGTVDLNGKADKVANATAGNFAGLDASGNLIDSGKSASDFDNVWLGTRAEHTAAETAGTLPGTAIVGITDESGSVVQSDWNQTDTTADDYIKNKPTIPVISQSATLTLTVNGWDSTTLQQTVTFAHDTTKRNVIDITVSEIEDWADYGVLAVSETASGITFKCEEIPESELTFTVCSMSVVSAN